MTTPNAPDTRDSDIARVKILHSDIEGYASTLSDVPQTFTRGKHGAITLTERGVFKMAAHGYDPTDISSIFGISTEALQHQFSDAMKAGRRFLSSRLKQRLIYLCLKDDKPQAELFKQALFHWAGFTKDGAREEPTEAAQTGPLEVNVNVVNKSKE